MAHYKHICEKCNVEFDEFYPMDEAPKRMPCPDCGAMCKARIRAQVETTRGWPMYSDALTVHPSQIEAQQAALARQGVTVEFRDDGAPKLESRAHRARVLRAMGYADANPGYSDPAPN